MQPTLAIFTVKKFAYCKGEYWTYGGFGDYLKGILPFFKKIILACHPRITREVPPGWYKVSDPKLEIFWLPYYEKEHECLFKLPKMWWKCRKPVKHADIVNPRVPDYSGLCGAFWARLKKKSMFTSLIDNWHPRVSNPSTRLKNMAKLGLQLHLRLYCFFEKILCKNGLLFAQGEELKKLYANNPLVNVCISTRHYRDDVVSFRQTCMNQKVIRILSVGRLVTVKGHHDLIKALNLLVEREKQKKFKLKILGEGRNRSLLIELIIKLDLQERVKFVGQTHPDDVFQYCDDSDIFCLPSHSEGTPKVILEAMARALPVVATKVGSVPTVVKNGNTGLLVPSHNPHTLANALELMASDDILRAKCIQNGLRFAYKHTVESEWSNMIHVVKNTYRELWSENKSST